VWSQSNGTYLTSAPSGQAPVRNYGVYTTGNHWFRQPTSAGENLGPGMFYQLGWSPEERNAIHRYWGVGLAWAGVKSRRQDSIGVGVTSAKLSDIATAETVTELFYMLQLTKHIMLQPDLQYVLHPSGVGKSVLLGGLRLGFQY
jgi:carbohydrate-selective porin OprB